MKKFVFFSALAAVACLPSAARAFDTIKVAEGKALLGKVTGVTATEVEYEQNSVRKTVPVNEVDFIVFEDEPALMPQVRTFLSAGRYQEALDTMDKIDEEVKQPEIKHDIAFYRAQAAARLALAGSGSKPDAGKQLLAFEKEGAASYHYFETCELLGDLLTSLNKFKEAEAYYDKLAATPWPDFQMRAKVLKGTALQSQKAHDQAIKLFDEALAMQVKGKVGEQQRLNAVMSKAVSLAAAGKNDEAVKLVEEVIAKADSKNQQLHARAYNVLGTCNRIAGKKKEALNAFLHVELLYAGFSEQHAEALYNLATLWKEVDKADRAEDAKTQLQKRYANSRWAQQTP